MIQHESPRTAVRLSAAIDGQVAERFWSKVDTSGDCWEWTAARNALGYGVFFVGRVGKITTQRLAHRVSLTLALGRDLIPGMHVDHMCDNRGCVNPAHLKEATPRENVLRTSAPPAVNSRKTHCLRGHEFTAANTHILNVKTGPQRRCRACDCIRHRKFKARRAA